MELPEGSFAPRIGRNRSPCMDTATTLNQRAEELALENEARLRLNLDGAHVGLFEWDVVTMRSVWSSGFYRMHGLEPGGPSSYQHWRDQVHTDDIERVEAEMGAAMEHGDAIDVDYRILHPAGELRWTTLQATIVRDGDGKPLKMIGYCGDVTRRKLADAALLQSERLAIAGRLSAAIAHEINNPLEAAYNLLYLARGMAGEDEQATLLDQGMEQLQRVSEISRQTLKFSRPTPPRMVKAAEVVDSALRLLAPKLALQCLQVSVQVSGDSEIWVSPGELQQILVNILNNAAEAGRMARPAMVRVRQAGGGVRITIADRGPGMTPETLRRLQEPFFTTKDGTGTGLGMWVVQELLEKWHGRMAIRSSVDPRHCGTVIVLFFPDAG